MNKTVTLDQTRASAIIVAVATELNDKPEVYHGYKGSGEVTSSRRRYNRGCHRGSGPTVGHHMTLDDLERRNAILRHIPSEHIFARRRAGRGATGSV